VTNLKEIPEMEKLRIFVSVKDYINKLPIARNSECKDTNKINKTGLTKKPGVNSGAHEG
jgi:hypothetical protein